MQKRNVLNSPRLLELKKRRQRTILFKIFIFSFAFLIFFILLAFISRLNSLNITEIKIIGNKIVDTEILKTTVKQQIAGKYLWLFPKTNILIYPQNIIRNELQNKFKRLNNINFSIKNNQILEISVTEREAKYTWCGSSIDLSVEEKCYFMDENGYIFDEAPYFSGEVYFKFYGLTIDDPLGYYFSKQNFKQLVSFKDSIIGMGLKPTALYVKNNEEAEIVLSKGNSAAAEPKIIFKTNADFKNIEENLDAALHTEPLQSKFKNKYSSLEYIDLRFGNKVYDKFQ